jgi:hypothetical protein
MMLKGLLLGALAVISQCAAVEVAMLYVYKDRDGNVSGVAAEKDADGSFHLAKANLSIPQNMTSSDRREYESKVGREFGLKAQYFSSPSSFLKLADAPPYRDPPGESRLPEVILPYPLPRYAKFSAGDLAIIASLDEEPSRAHEQMVSKPAAPGSELIYLPCKADANGKVTAFLALPAEDGKLRLFVHRDLLPLSAKSDSLKELFAKVALNAVAKQEPEGKFEYVRNGQLRIIKEVTTEPFENVEEPFRVIPYPIPGDIQLSKEDLAIIKALHPTPYLLYAGIGAGVVVVIIVVAVFVVRHFKNKNKQSYPF